MARFKRAFVIFQLCAAVLQLTSAQNIIISPISSALNPSFTMTVAGTNIPYPLIFQYLYDVASDTTIQVDSPTSTAVFPFLPGAAQTLAVYCPIPRFEFNMFMAMAPTAGGPNSVGISVPPISLGQTSVTVTFLGNVLYPLTFVVEAIPFTMLASGTLQEGTSTVVFDAPTAFNRMIVTAENTLGSQVDLAITPFLGITASPTLVRTGSSITVSVTATANSDASLTYQLFDGTNPITSTELDAGSTVWEFEALGAANVYTLSVLNGDNSLVVHGMAYTTLTVVTAPFIVEPTPGALLLTGTTISAVITGCGTASSYTLTFGNGLYNYVTTVPGSVATVPALPVPRNYIGQLYLTAAQDGSSNVATYTISVAQAVYKARRLRNRARVGR